MTPDEAIRVLTENVRTHDALPLYGVFEAEKLGIEAIENWATLRKRLLHYQEHFNLPQTYGEFLSIMDEIEQGIKTLKGDQK